MKATPALTLFGIPRWQPQTGEGFVLTAERPCQLLAMLAVRRVWVPRDELATLFWPDRPQSAARSNLRKVLLLAQRRIAPSTIEQRGELLRWTPDTDLVLLQQALEQADQLDEVLARRPATLLEGLDAGLDEAALAWLVHERHRIEASWHAAAVRRLTEAGRMPEGTAALAQRMLDHDALDEDALAAGVEAWITMRQPARARLALDAHRAALSTQLGLQPGPALRALDERVRRAGAAEGDRGAIDAGNIHAGPASFQSSRHGDGSSAPKADFIGRRLEISQCADLFAQAGCRLLTVLGPGGVGKTRLLRAAQERLAATRPEAGGPHWVALEDVATAEDVPRRIADVMALQLGNGAPWDELGMALSARRDTLLLDNAEHLSGLGGCLTKLLDEAPTVKIVASSRTRLHAFGEWLLPLDGMPLPDVDELDLEVLKHSDSIRLFEQAANAVAPGFDWRREAEATVRLVHVVEGLPLALQLAANWVRMMPIAEIAGELTASTELLNTGVTSTRRDVSLRASFHHSWKLLTPAERDQLAALAQLPAAFDRAMAAQVCGTPIVVLGALVDKSLLRAEGSSRFSLHPLIRQSTLETAAPSNADTLRFRHRHAAYVARWLWDFRERRTLSRVGLDVVGRDWPHVRDAWQHAIAEHDAEFIYIAGSTVMFYLELRAMWVEGRAMMRAGADAFAETTLSGRRAIEICLRALARFDYRAGQMDDAERDARRGLRLARRLGDTNGAKAQLNTLGIAYWLRGAFEQARPYYEQALEIALQDGEQADVLGFQANLAVLDYSLGRYDDALHRMEAMLPATRAGVDPFALINLLTNMAASQLALMAWSAALERAEESLALMSRHGFAITRGETLLIAARALRPLRRAAEAGERADEALALGRGGGESAVIVEALLQRALLALDADDRDAASRSLSEAARVARQSGTMPVRWRCVSVDAMWRAASGDKLSAIALLQRAMAVPELEALERDEAQRWRDALSAAETPADLPTVSNDIDQLLDEIEHR